MSQREYRVTRDDEKSSTAASPVVDLDHIVDEQPPTKTVRAFFFAQAAAIADREDEKMLGLVPRDNARTRSPEPLPVSTRPRRPAVRHQGKGDR